ncbi:hypothetical protein GQ457_06G009720 [Hibiscus cannabinus]
MSMKFDKYWNSVNGIMGVGTLLDPRYKTTLLEYYFENIYGIGAESEVERIVQLCQDLVTEYEEKMMSSNNEPQCFTSTSLDSVPVDLGDPGDFDAYVSRKKQKKLKVKSELDRYLELDIIPRTPNFDILAWWKMNGPQFPILQVIARDIYAIPISTVTSESTFSTAGRLVNAQRNRLHPSTVEALACCQNWLWAEEEGMHCPQCMQQKDMSAAVVITISSDDMIPHLPIGRTGGGYSSSSGLDEQSFSIIWPADVFLLRRVEPISVAGASGDGCSADGISPSKGL